MAAIIGGGIGYGISFLFGDAMYWIFLCAVFAIATDSAVRMMRSGQHNHPPSSARPDIDEEMSKDQKPEKPPDPHF